MTMALLAVLLTAMAQQPKALRKAENATLPKPVAKLATNITNNSFTANWDAVEGAEGYSVTVYRKDVASNDGVYTLVDEDFAGIDFGSIGSPAGGDENYVDLSQYTTTPGWSAYAFPTFIPSMVAGKIYSPEIDLKNNGGKYKLIITSYSSNGDEILIESHGKGEVVKKVYTTTIANGTSGMSTDTIEFDNGCEHLYFSVINQSAEQGSFDYFDRIQVVQNLKKNDIVYTCVDLNDAIDAETESGEKITSNHFGNVTRCADGATILYYDIFASAYNFGYDDDGNFTYNYTYSPYSDLIKVDLEKGISEIAERDNATPDNPEEPKPDDPTQDEPDPNAPQVVDGKLTLGEFNGERDDKAAYDGFNTQNSPIAFTYNHSGSQTIYLPSQLANMKGMQIKSLTFKCFSDAYYTSDYISNLKLYLKEVDNDAFFYNAESEHYEWFDFDKENAAAETTLNIDFLTATAEEEDIPIVFDLSANPFTYTGKTLLVTVVNDSEGCIDPSELVRFYWVKAEKGDAYRTAIFASDNNDFFYNIEQNRRITATENEYRWQEAPAVQFEVEAPEQLFSGGSGTEEDPYLISNTDDLEALNEATNSEEENKTEGRYYKVTNDILTPYTGMIGTVGVFHGIFDGDGHTIVVNIERNEDFVGLFGTTSRATIKNLQVAGSVKANDYVAAVVGNPSNGTRIENVANYADVTGKMRVGGVAGGIVSVSSSGNVGVTVDNCANYGTIKGDNMLGGVVGYSGQQVGNTLTRLINYGYIDGPESTEYDRVGGTIGNSLNGDIVKGIVNVGTMSNNTLAGSIGNYNTDNQSEVFYDSQTASTIFSHEEQERLTSQIIGNGLENKANDSEMTAEKWLYEEDMLPRLRMNGMENNDGAILFATPIILDSNDKLDNITKDFKVGVKHGAEWRSVNGKVSFSNEGDATIMGEGSETLIASLGGYEHVYNVYLHYTPNEISNPAIADAYSACEIFDMQGRLVGTSEKDLQTLPRATYIIKRNGTVRKAVVR